VVISSHAWCLASWRQARWQIIWNYRPHCWCSRHGPELRRLWPHAQTEALLERSQSLWDPPDGRQWAYCWQHHRKWCHRGDSYSSEKTKSPGSSLFILRTPLGALTRVDPFFGVRSCLPSWHAAHLEGRMVADPILSPLGVQQAHIGQSIGYDWPAWQSSLSKLLEGFNATLRVNLAGKVWRWSFWVILPILEYRHANNLEKPFLGQRFTLLFWYYVFHICKGLFGTCHINTHRLVTLLLLCLVVVCTGIITVMVAVFMWPTLERARLEDHVVW
jgi:hypothetical protein